jgi:capsular exopolysaccharide synthesis family protein
MNNLEKYLDQVIEQKPVVYEPPAEVQEPPTMNVLESVRKRWPTVLATAIVICAVGLPAIWFLVEPLYIVRGTVKIKQTVPSLLTGEPLAGEVANYAWFVNTEAHNLMNNEISLQAVLDDLVPQGLSFFASKPQNRMDAVLWKIFPIMRDKTPREILTKAISDRDITAAYLPNTELLAVTMKSYRLDEARKIVDSFLRNYVARSKTESSLADFGTRSALEAQQKELQEQIKRDQDSLRAVAQLSPATVIDPNQQLVKSTLALLQNELLRLEVQRIKLEGDILVFDPCDQPDVLSEQFLAARMDYVNADPSIKELTTNVVQMERDLIVAQQTQKATYPALQQRQEVLAALKARLQERQTTLEEEFKENWQKRLNEMVDLRRKQIPEERKQVETRIAQVRKMLDDENKKLTVEAQNIVATRVSDDNLRQNLQMLELVTRRIAQLKMEEDRRPRIETAVPAMLMSEEDKRLKLAGATVFGALACGVGLALLREKMNKTLQTPTDITRQTDLPVLGTTTSSRTIKPALFAEQIAGDYQTIRTNLGLLYNGGMPKKLVVTSAGMREGKTTFAVNLATSLAKSGKKVLLIDGDMRKPDIGHMLNVLNNEGGLQNVLLGEDPAGIVCVLPTSGLHVLAANPRYLGDSYELLTSSTAAGQMERLAREYDHLIVDSPPTLAFPDALVWAKLTDAVILVSFAGQTTAPELKEAKERFARIRARILGTVLSNVPADQGLYRYSYTYRSRGAQTGHKGGKPKKMLLSTGGQTDGERPPEA